MCDYDACVGDINPCNVFCKCNCLVKKNTYVKTYIIPYAGEFTLWTTWNERNNPPFNKF